VRGLRNIDGRRPGVHSTRETLQLIRCPPALCLSARIAAASCTTDVYDSARAFLWHALVNGRVKVRNKRADKGETRESINSAIMHVVAEHHRNTGAECGGLGARGQREDSALKRYADQRYTAARAD